jgi:hypothetical protein
VNVTKLLRGLTFIVLFILDMWGCILIIEMYGGF